MKRITVIIEGPDADKAFAELLSNIQYDKLDVKVVKIERRDD